ncbi:MAG TPA: hypothetical protein VFT88_07425 [Acidobacteriaceae bacterium]|jgi:hypothetical protein|nr:hypothetical protein [Acidobacteriaceae bacterium]
MAQSKPAALCSHLMPSGKLCRGVALRNEHYCRSHIRNYRILELDLARNAAIERLALEVRRMDLHDLLVVIKDRLVILSRSYTIARFPEICFLLTVAIDWLYDARSEESNLSPQVPLDQAPEDIEQLSPSEINQMIAGLFKSNT